MREIVSLHVGQAGIQLGNSVWDLYCKEHQISPDGTKINSLTKETKKTDFSTFFKETKSGKRKYL
jgi:tubulin alpha